MSRGAIMGELQVIIGAAVQAPCSSRLTDWLRMHDRASAWLALADDERPALLDAPLGRWLRLMGSTLLCGYGERAPVTMTTDMKAVNTGYSFGGKRVVGPWELWWEGTWAQCDIGKSRTYTPAGSCIRTRRATMSWLSQSSGNCRSRTRIPYWYEISLFDFVQAAKRPAGCQQSLSLATQGDRLTLNLAAPDPVSQTAGGSAGGFLVSWQFSEYSLLPRVKQMWGSWPRPREQRDSMVSYIARLT